MKNFIKRWLAITPEDIICDECDCCDEKHSVTQEDVNIMLIEEIERLTPKPKNKVGKPKKK